METKKQTLGELIGQEVKRQGMQVTEFAKGICCLRNNAYNIFKRGDNISVAQLKLISNVLGRNFFEDVSRNLDLVDLENEEVKRDLENRKAVSQFMEVMPGILEGLNISPLLVYSQFGNQTGKKLPDFSQPDYNITFTKGERLLDRMNGNPGQLLEVKSYKAPSDSFVDVWINQLSHTVSLDIAIIYHSEEEWKSIMEFAVREVMPMYVTSYGFMQK